MATELSKVSAAALDGRMRNLRYRQKELISLHKWLTSNVDDIQEGIQKDTRCTSDEARLVVAKTLTELRTHYDDLDLKAELKVEYSIKDKRSCPDRHVAPGIVYIIPEKFTLFFSIISALCAAVEAGNCCVVELGNDLNSTPALLRRCFSEALDNEAFAFTTSRPDDFPAKCLVVDQTGTFQKAHSPLVASSPSSRAIAFVDRTADLTIAAREIVAARAAFGGKSPYAPDFVLVNEFVEEDFLQAVDQEISRVSAASKGQANGQVNGYANGHANGHAHHHKLRNGTTASKTDGAHQTSTSEKELKSVEKITDRKDTRLQRKDTSTSLLVRKYSSLDDAIDTLGRSGEKSLALYVFAGPSPAKYLAQFIPAGTSFVNHIPGDMLVGPASPLDLPISTAVRYTRAMFETPSPQFVRPVHDTVMSATLLNSSSQRASQFYSDAIKPLSPTGQPENKDMNFFIMALRAGALVYLLPVVSAGLASAVYGAVSLYRTLR
ncbi:hypothetical protein MMC13_001257 [Lambiella insularis]|nr:hypothetical protein [Lambiella insularis]